MVILAITACVAENDRGHSVWRKYHQQCEAKGERFDRIVCPQAGPPDENFAATRFFAGKDLSALFQPSLRPEVAGKGLAGPSPRRRGETRARRCSGGASPGLGAW